VSRLRRLVALVRLGHRTTSAERFGVGPGVVLAVGAFLVVVTLLTSWGAWNVIRARQERFEARQIEDIEDIGSVDHGVLVTSRDVAVGDSILTIVAIGSVRGVVELAPGIDRFPEVGEMVVSPAIRENPEVATSGVLPYRDTGIIADEGLVTPADLIAYVGVSDVDFIEPGGREPFRFEGFGRPYPNPVFSPALMAFYDAFAVLIVLVGFGAVIRAAVRMSEALQSRRLAALRALGLTPAQLRVVAATRGLMWCAAGSIAGGALFALAAPRVSRVPFTNISYFPADVGFGWVPAILVAVAVPVVSASISSFPSHPRRSGDVRQRKAWRTWLAPVSLLALALVPLLPSGPSTTYVWWAAAAAVFVSVGVGTTGLIQAVGSRMGESAAPAVRLAGRRLVDRAGANSRLFTPLGALLLVALVAVPVARATNADARQSGIDLLGQMGRRVVSVQTTSHDLNLFGEHMLAVAPRLASYAPSGDDFYGGEVLVMTCDQLHGLSAPCPTRPAYVPAPDGTNSTHRVTVRAARDDDYETMEPAIVPVDLSRHPIDQLPGMVVVTPDMLPRPLSDYEFDGYTVFLDTSPDALADLQTQVARQQPTARVVSTIDNDIAYASILLPVSIGSTVATTLLALLLILAIAIAVMSQAIEANRLHAPLKMMGSTPRFATRAYLWQMLPPATIVATISIVAAVLTMRSLTIVWRAPVTPSTTVAVYATAAVAGIAATAVAGTRFLHAPLTPELLNNE